MAMPSQTITFRLPSTFAKEVEQRAKAANTTPGTWVRQLVLNALNEQPADSATERVEPTAAAGLTADATLGRVKEVVDDCLKAFFQVRPSSSDGVADEGRKVPDNWLKNVERLNFIDQGLQRIAHSLATFEAQVGSLTALPPKVEATIRLLNGVHRKLDKHHAFSMDVSDWLQRGDAEDAALLSYLHRDLGELREHLSLSVMALLTESGRMTPYEAGDWVTKFLTHDDGTAK